MLRVDRPAILVSLLGLGEAAQRRIGTPRVCSYLGQKSLVTDNLTEKGDIQEFSENPETTSLRNRGIWDLLFKHASALD